MHRLVIVEDHPVMQETLAMVLRRVPRIEISGLIASAEEALAELRSPTPDLVLVDVSLPGMSGIELIEKLVVENPQLKCLVISGHNPSVYASKARNAGACGFVSKDNPVELLEAVRTVLQGGAFWPVGQA